MSNSRFTFVMGGIRSGKSAFGEAVARDMAARHGGQVIYVATGQAVDEEMVRRIEKHRKGRPDHWLTIEAGDDLPAVISGATEDQVLLIDSVAEWLTSHLLSKWEKTERTQLESEIESESRRLISAIEASSAILVVIGHEVGLAPVAPYPMGRAFCDLNGLLNQGLAAIAGDVWSLRAGLPQKLK